MKKACIVYYSRSGATAQVSERLSITLNLDVIEVSDNRNTNINSSNKSSNNKSKEKKWLPQKIFQYIQSGFEASIRHSPPITLKYIKGTNATYEDNINFQQYDIIFIATPVWMGNLSSPIRSFLIHNLPKNIPYGIFYTCSGNTSERLDQKLSKEAEMIVGMKLIIVMGLSKNQIKNGVYELSWCDRIHNLLFV